jgi:hypothetical protein
MPYGFSYGMMANASKGALEREQSAKDLYLATKKDFEESIKTTTKKDMSPGTKHTIPLLQPDHHLTSYTWGTFNRWVKENHKGWTAKRRLATPEETKAAEAYNSGKSYFVDVVYQVHDPKKKAKTKKAPPPPADDDKKPSATKKMKRAPPKNRVGPSAFDSLLENVQLRVLSFADVPTLHSLSLSSKHLGELAKQDEAWAPNLKFLLEDLFDDAFIFPDDVIPIFNRPNWKKSTEFLVWYKECAQYTRQKNSVNGMPLEDVVEEPEEYGCDAATIKWLLEDVSLREYYKHAAAGAYACEGMRMHHRTMEGANRCPGCIQKQWGCCCRAGNGTPGLFHNMPRIRLFRHW